ncbi:MAG: HIT family protein [Candidatus Magasanikbacteria bacterium]
MDCLFCKIIAGEIPCHKVFENESVLAFLDIHPCSKGHTVVIPKNHAKNIEEISSDDWQKLAVGLKIAVARVQEVLKPAGMNIGLNNNEVAGQAVPHIHYHIIPRYDGDGGGSMHSIVRAPVFPPVSDVAKLFE